MAESLRFPPTNARPTWFLEVHLSVLGLGFFHINIQMAIYYNTPAKTKETMTEVGNRKKKQIRFCSIKM